MSRVDRYTGVGDVVRCVYVLPSDRVTSCVNVYGRCGRRRSVACRHCVQTYVVVVVDVVVVEAVVEAVGVVVRGTIVVIVAAVRRNGVASDMMLLLAAGFGPLGLVVEVSSFTGEQRGLLAVFVRWWMACGGGKVEKIPAIRDIT